MSLIVSEVYDALIEAGTSEEKAKAAAGSIPMVEKLAAKDDIVVLTGDIVALRDELKGEIAALRDELKGEIAALRDELKGEIAALRHDLTVLKLAVFSFAPAILALLVKLVFFP